MMNVKGKVWLYPGLAGWHFLTVPKVDSIDLRKKFPKGFIPINAKLGETAWRTSLFPTKEGNYLLALKASVRKKEGIMVGEVVEVKYEFV